MIEFETPTLIKNIIAKQVEEEFLLIDNIDRHIFVYPDFIQKRRNTISSGVVIESSDDIYPCAIPDIGCGFRLIRIEGINVDDFANNIELLDRIRQFLSGSDLSCIFPEQDSFDRMLYEGHSYTKKFFTHDRSALYEDGGHYELPPNHKLSNEIYPDANVLKRFNKYQGHFFELLYTSNKMNSVYVLIHCGSFELATRYMNYYFPLLAKEAYINKWSTKEEVVNGKFHIPKTSEIGVKYYSDIKCLMNFAFSYRDMIEFNIIDIITKYYNKKTDVVLLSDFIHTKLSIGEKVIHQRGVQRLTKNQNNEYLIAGNYGIASMLFKVNSDSYFGHGIQVNSSIFHELPDDRNLVTDRMNLNISAHLLEQTKATRACYDYYLQNKNIELIEYLYPFYSYKEA